MEAPLPVLATVRASSKSKATPSFWMSLGFVVEGVDVGDATGHEEEDDAFGAGGVVGEEDLRFGI
jgi:hypothetical protein